MPSDRIRSYEEFRRRYFPNAVEREFQKNATPEEIGKRLAQRALDHLRQARRGEQNEDGNHAQ